MSVSTTAPLVSTTIEPFTFVAPVVLDIKITGQKYRELDYYCVTILHTVGLATHLILHILHQI